VPSWSDQAEAIDYEDDELDDDELLPDRDRDDDDRAWGWALIDIEPI
jgi:hypothetical protein